MPGFTKRTIKKLLRHRFKDFTNSITDENVKKLVEDNTIITGGCIASMLLGEPINDYDIYFRNKETAWAYAQYICNEFNKNNTTISAVKDYKPQVREIKVKNILGEEEERIVFWMQSAGMAEEDNKEEYTYFECFPHRDSDDFINSIDINEFDPIETAKEIEQDLKPGKDKPKYRPVFLSDNAATLSDKVQVIVRFWGDPAQIHRTFDFAHAMCWYDCKKDHLELPAEAMECLLTKTLVYKGSLYPIASLFRTRKFIKRGWRISAGQMLKIIMQLNNVPLDNPIVLKEQLMGVDMAYMMQLITELKNHEGKVDATYLATLIDKVFED